MHSFWCSPFQDYWQTWAYSLTWEWLRTKAGLDWSEIPYSGYYSRFSGSISIAKIYPANIIIRLLHCLELCQSRRRPYRPHMALLQYFRPATKSCQTRRAHCLLWVASLSPTLQFFSDSCLPYRFVDVEPCNTSLHLKRDSLNSPVLELYE